MHGVYILVVLGVAIGFGVWSVGKYNDNLQDAANEINRNAGMTVACVDTTWIPPTVFMGSRIVACE